jgi:hypothetical protein
MSRSTRCSGREHVRAVTVASSLRRVAVDHVVRPLVVDPGGYVVRRALRVAVLGTAAFVVVGRLLHRDAEAAAALFAIIALDGFTDFWGPPRRRFVRYVAAGAVAACAFPLVEVVRSETWLLLAATAVVTFATYFAGVLGGPFFAARFPVMIAFLYAATTPQLGRSVREDVVGWMLGTVAAAGASVLLWPASRRYPIRSLVADLAAELSRCLRPPAGADAATLHVLTDRLRSVTTARRLRTGAPAAPDRLLAETVHQTERLVAMVTLVTTGVTGRVEPARQSEDEQLCSVVADVLDSVAAVIGSSPRSTERATRVPCPALVDAIEAHLDAGRDRVESPGSTPDQVDVAVASSDVRAVAVAALVLAELVEAWRTGDGGGLGVDALTSSGPVDSIRRHANLDSLWFRNSLRATVAITAAVGLVVLGAGSGRGFWLVLGTMSVLRADLSTISRTATTAILGTAIGYLVSAALLGAVGNDEYVLWVFLPVLLFLTASASGLHPLVSSASFTTFVVVTVTITNPAFDGAGQVRLANIAIGALVALAISVVLWPRVGTVPEGAVAHVLRRLADGLRSAPDGSRDDPTAQLVDLDRVFDMVETSAPHSVPVRIRSQLQAIAEVAASAALLVVGGPVRLGVVSLDLRVSDWDTVALAALRADLDGAARALDGLAERIEGAAPVAEAAGPRTSALVRLATERVGPPEPGSVGAVDLVRLGAATLRAEELAGLTPGVRHGRTVTRVG